ncbi:Lysophospholipase, alpha-beta hydrolase superfamily [Butyrivibrio proteoclasticus]|uniref:Lysophospholipase, alpha-beta hydrolase superfamily n=1 Tax=Butyrivibrio proteoclasticus TaxID=43305 RepID=A0A1I5R8S0_9FIRM|nr:alpha/beta hydrolase [Butyrivibrio proteoclasticus]SFP54934.1 Lysophospholipase, alpha-beta hydrolase superfamily [Butyrivibrio proteoclasticus]
MEKYDVTKPVILKKGVYKLNGEANFNYQLNRVINWDGGRLEDVEKVSGKIHNSDDWKRELILLGDEAMKEGRTDNAIAYYRMSEFFMYDGDPDKRKYYEKATKLFYEYYADFFEGENPRIERYDVPYENVKLPVMHVVPYGESKGTILIHGGNDSYFEEFLFTVLYMQEQGFEVYMFEGPGQGGVMRVQGMHFTHEWEKPVKVILDYFKLSDVTIIGISLGGYLAPRAAAFDKRITKVVAWSIFPCFQDILVSMQPQGTQRAFHILMKLHARPLLNLVFGKKAKKSPIIDWGIKHGCYAYEAKDAYSYAKKLKLYDIAPVADQITQDMLILGASGDHFIDYHLIGKEINMLRNVRSLTFRLFTDKEEAENHCNVGNGKLAIDEILSWITRIGSKE